METAANAKALFRLQPFNYGGVCLLERMLKRQLDATRDTYFNIPNDSLLLGFRPRAGMPALGREWVAALAVRLHGSICAFLANGDGPAVFDIFRC